MIRCTVCQTENDDFATSCIRCRGFLQNRIPNLNFFETLWRVLETPRKAFHDVTLAEHKNYAFLLFAFLGVSVAFTGLWYFRAGERFDSLLTLIAWGLVGGSVLGIVCGPLTALVHYGASWVLRGKTAFRNSLGIVAYSLTPVAVSLVFVLPIELMTFGIYLFTSNPPPYSIKPVSFVVLAGFDVVVTVWTIGLAIVGTTIANRLTAFRASCVVFVSLAALVLPLWEAGQKLSGIR
ncbi:MAG TPA: Yip1 family protein [Bacteroidota bacterium]|nr:Yip1 family protein [Bacteroidota bacterium]